MFLLSVECEITLSNLYIYLTNSFYKQGNDRRSRAVVRFPLDKTSLLKRSIPLSAKNQYRVQNLTTVHFKHDFPYVLLV